MIPKFLFVTKLVLFVCEWMSQYSQAINKHSNFYKVGSGGNIIKWLQIESRHFLKEKKTSREKLVLGKSSSPTVCGLLYTLTYCYILLVKLYILYAFLCDMANHQCDISLHLSLDTSIVIHVRLLLDLTNNNMPHGWYINDHHR